MLLAIDKKSIRNLSAILSVGIVCIALWFLYHALRSYGFEDIWARLVSVPTSGLLVAAGLTVASYLVLTTFDWLALHYLKVPLRYERLAFASFVSQAISHNTGFGALTGGSIRFRIYSAAGLSAGEVAMVVAFCGLTFWLGSALLVGFAFLHHPQRVAEVLHLPLVGIHDLGLGLLVAVGGYLVWTTIRRMPLELLGFLFPLPSPRITVIQTFLAAFDMVLAAGTLYVLLPPAAHIPFSTFVSYFVVAIVGGVLSHAPGGLGVFETLMLLLLREAPRDAVFGALLLYRAIYNLAPLAIAALLLGGYEAASGHHDQMRRTARLLGDWARQLVPGIMAVTVFMGGALLLFSGATPEAPERMSLLARFLPVYAMELSHLLGSIAGIGLVLLARGLFRRLDTAWLVTMGLLAASVVLQLLKGVDYEEAVIMALLLLALAPCRSAFYRKGSLLAERFTPGWAAAVAVVVLTTLWLSLFSYKDLSYSNELWWKFAFESNAPRALRALVVIMGIALGVAIAHLLRPSTVRAEPPGAASLARVGAIVAASPDAESHLVWLGDKSLLFNPSGDAFIMYGVQRRSWIVMGNPVGPRAAWEGLVWQFRELCDRYDGRPVFYKVDESSLPLYLELGLSFFKLGEEGRVPLESFSLAGSARQELRYIHRRAQKDGASFEMLPAGSATALQADLARVSEAWLHDKRAREKRFSMGCYDLAYLDRFPLAIVRSHGTIVAFANLWPAPAGKELAIDLMRHTNAVGYGVMDYLIIESLLWGRANDYLWFSLGIAPLSGLQDRALAPLWARLGAFVHRNGEEFYNFQGLRRFKEKYTPQWQPIYLASPGGMTLPAVIADVASLISGGVKGLVTK
jgi:phosphatidylglycerol lysyltransferase